MKNKSFTNLTPFKLCVLQNFPFIEEDFDALTNYELLCKVVEKLNDVIKNNNIQNEYIESFINYFNNLDVQKEINNKLDIMASDGTLDTIINQHIFNELNTQINTLNGRINDEINTVNGRINETNQTINDEINTVNGRINETNQTINDEINNINNDLNLQNSKVVVCIGDSYAKGSSAGSIINGWPIILKQNMGLSNDEFYNFHEGGSGFVRRGLSNHNFLELLQANMSQIVDKTVVKKIIVCGGHNDYEASREEIQNAMNDFVSYCISNFPNATLYAGMIAGNLQTTSLGITRRTAIYGDILYAYSTFNGLNKKCIYLTGLENIMKNERYMSSDLVHPNQTGYNHLGWEIYNAINGNCEYISNTKKNIFDVALNLAETSGAKKFSIYTDIVGNITSLSHGQHNFLLNAPINLNANNLIKFLENMPIRRNYPIINFMCTVKINNVWHTLPAQFVPSITDNSVSIKLFPESNTALTGITQIFIQAQSYTIGTIENYFNSFASIPE